MKWVPGAGLMNRGAIFMALIMFLGQVSGCGRPKVEDQAQLEDCFPCENIPGDLVWDADGDGQDDFVFYQTGRSPAVVGLTSTSFHTSLGFLVKSEATNLLYPVEPGMWISTHSEWNKYRTIGLGHLHCESYVSTSDKEWDGPFTGPDGDVFAFRLEGEEANLVGVARIRLSKCDGWVDILSVRTASEAYGLFVGDEAEADFQ